MTKFKIGDEVEFIQNYGSYEIGDVVEVTGIWDSEKGVFFKGNKGNGNAYTQRFKSFTPKKSKNQRITALEKEVKRSDKYSEGLREQLTDALKRIEVLEKAHEPSTIIDVEDKPLSPNQQRAQIIEDAKKFVEDCKDFTGLITNRKGYRAGTCRRICDAEFVVKTEKRTVVCILKEQLGKSIQSKGIAKCNPSDVFNKHIGKAVALGRALGLDVTKFEQAVQPERAPEQIALYKRKVVTFKGDDYGPCNSNRGTVNWNSIAAIHSKILNDTNAQYGGGE